MSNPIPLPPSPGKGGMLYGGFAPKPPIFTSCRLWATSPSKRGT